VDLIAKKTFPEQIIFKIFQKVFEKENLVNGIFSKLVNKLEEILPGFSKNLVTDGNAIFLFKARK
jgi:hypothetical protein